MNGAETIDLLRLDGDALEEGERVMQICNACRYCEGFCPVFPAMTQQAQFGERELSYLAHLCHNCTACYHACQYKPPHDFAVNVPRALTRLRAESFADLVWPGFMRASFARNGTLTALIVTVVMLVLVSASFYLQGADTLFAVHREPGAFYQIIGHGLMVVLSGGCLLFGLTGVVISGLRFRQQLGHGAHTGGRWYALRRALAAAARLDHLGGGHDDGCNTADERFSNARRYAHHGVMWGFALCFAATLTASFYELVLGRLSPFPYLSLPVVLGTTGGVGILVGGAGLLVLRRRFAEGVREDKGSMDLAFTLLLMVISATGLALLALRESVAMGSLLVVHLALVLSFFVLLPYSKAPHGLYRLLALYTFYRTSESGVAPTPRS